MYIYNPDLFELTRIYYGLFAVSDKVNNRIKKKLEKIELGRKISGQSLYRMKNIGTYLNTQRIRLLNSQSRYLE